MERKKKLPGKDEPVQLIVFKSEGQYAYHSRTVVVDYRVSIGLRAGTLTRKQAQTIRNEMEQIRNENLQSGTAWENLRERLSKYNEL